MDPQKKERLLFLGIDDAGRGPVIGPMVLAGCLANSETLDEFKKIGVRDSKQVTQKRREFFEKIIKEKSESFEVEIISADEIDKKNAEGIKLNELEAITSANIINKLNKGDKKIKVILDCPSVSINKWKDFLKTHVENLSNLEIFCEHKADRNHIVVSAASILAKCQREKEMGELKKIYGEGIGSGYGSDPATKKFLEKNAGNSAHSKIFRKTWTNWKQANSNLKQKKLFE